MGRTVLNTLIFQVLFVLTLAPMSVRAQSSSKIPAWAKIESGWTADPVFPERVVFTYKTDRAFMVVEQTPVGSDFVVEDWEKHLRENYDADSREELEGFIGDISESAPKIETFKEKVGNIATVTFVAHFTTVDKENLLAEKFWFKDGQVWHVIFAEMSGTILPADSYKRAFQLLESNLLQSGKNASFLENQLKRFEALLKVQSAFAAETRRSGNGGRGQPVASRAITQQCRSTGFDDKFLRAGPPGIDWNAIPSGCRTALARIPGAVGGALTSAWRSITGPEDFPQFEPGQDRGCARPNPYPKVWTDCKNKERCLEYTRCAYNSWFTQGARRTVNAVRDYDYRGLLSRAWRTTKATVVDLASNRGRATGSAATRAGQAYNAWAEQNRLKIACLKAPEQGEAMCARLTGAGAVGTTAICTVASRGKCRGALTAATRGLDGIFGKYLKRAPAAVATVARPDGGLQFARNFLRNGRLDRVGATNLSTDDRRAAGQFLLNGGKDYSKVDKALLAKREKLVDEMHAICSDGRSGGFGNWSEGCLTGKMRRCLTAMNEGVVSRKGCRDILDSGVAGQMARTARTEINPATGNPWFPYGAPMGEAAATDMYAQAAKQFSIKSWENRIPGFERMSTTDQRNAVSRWFDSNSDPTSVGFDRVYGMRVLDNNHRQVFETRATSLNASIADPAERTMASRTYRDAFEGSVSGRGEVASTLAREQFTRDPDGFLSYLESTRSRNTASERLNMRRLLERLRTRTEDSSTQRRIQRLIDINRD